MTATLTTPTETASVTSEVLATYKPAEGEVSARELKSLFAKGTRIWVAADRAQRKAYLDSAHYVTEFRAVAPSIAYKRGLGPQTLAAVFGQATQTVGRIETMADALQLGLDVESLYTYFTHPTYRARTKGIVDVAKGGRGERVKAELSDDAKVAIAAKLAEPFPTAPALAAATGGPSLEAAESSASVAGDAVVDSAVTPEPVAPTVAEVLRTLKLAADMAEALTGSFAGKRHAEIVATLKRIALAVGEAPVAAPRPGKVG